MIEVISETIKQIIEKFHPEKIIMFGSYTYGKPGQNSDLDLLIVMNYKGSSKKQAVKIIQSIDYHFPIDLIVRSTDQIHERIRLGDFFFKDIIDKGKILYDRNIYGMD